MKLHRSRQLTALLLILILSFTLISCGKEKDGKQIVLTTGFEDNELFVMGENKCYLPEAKVYIRTLASNYESFYGPEIMNVNIGDIKVSDKLISLGISRLAKVKAMVLLAEERGITLSEGEARKCDQAAERFINSLSDADKRDLGIDAATATSMYRDYALAQKAYKDITKEINPEISDDEARTITIKRLLIKSTDHSNALQIANSLRSLAVEGTDFDSLIDEYSEDDNSVYSFGKDTDLFPAEFVEACFSLSSGEFSDVIVTDEGCSIAQCISTFDMEETDANKERMVKERKNQAFEEVYSSFVADLYTNFNLELWENTKINESPLDSQDNFFAIYDDVFSV